MLQRITDEVIERMHLRCGGGMTLAPGGAILGMDAVESEPGRRVPLPDAGLPEPRGGVFEFNLIPVRGCPVDLEAEIPYGNVKAYVRALVTPVSYEISGLGTHGISYAGIDSMELVTVPHGAVPTRINATVNAGTGAVSQGVYYFYCAKLFSDGRVQGFGSGDGTDDTDYWYPNITSFGWLPPPSAGTHYPPIDLV